MKTINEIRADLKARKDRSAWDKGVTVYALELLEQIEENRKFNDLGAYLEPHEVKPDALNGASSWDQYSWGGSALIYDCDIAERLCCPSELKKVRGGERRPNSREEWLDVQARALYQACSRVVKAARG